MEPEQGPGRRHVRGPVTDLLWWAVRKTSLARHGIKVVGDEAVWHAWLR